MSGQLVGEVIAASDVLRAHGVSERGFQALIAIAEKANANTRKASVRWDHIRAAQYGRSLATAKRAIKELESGGYIRKVKRGFNNQQGRSAAPVYELCTLAASDSHATSRDANDSPMVTHSGAGEQLTHDDPFGTSASDLLDHSSDRMDHETRPNGSNAVPNGSFERPNGSSMDDLLDGLTPDGFTPDAQTTDEERRLLRDPGTSPGQRRESSAAFLKMAEQLYSQTEMERQCPNCRADAHQWCRREDGSQKRIPCLARARRPA